jgi:hypothetical protein
MTPMNMPPSCMTISASPESEVTSTKCREKMMSWSRCSIDWNAVRSQVTTRFQRWVGWSREDSAPIK